MSIKALWVNPKGYNAYRSPSYESTTPPGLNAIWFRFSINISSLRDGTIEVNSVTQRVTMFIKAVENDWSQGQTIISKNKKTAPVGDSLLMLCIF